MGAEFGSFRVFFNADISKGITIFPCKCQNQGGRRFNVLANLQWPQHDLRRILPEFGTDRGIGVGS